MHVGKAPETAKELPLAETVKTSKINYLIGGGGSSHQRTRLRPSGSLFTRENTGKFADFRA